MNKQKSDDKETDAKKREAVTKKLKSERNKYFVPELGEIEAESLADLEKKLKERQEDK
mgnify:CR=1 FL=1